MDGPGTVLNLASVQSFNDGYFQPNYANFHALNASNGGIIDLSGLQVLTLALEGDDRLDFKAESGAQIKLPSLSSLIGSGYAKFDVTASTIVVGNLPSGKSDIAVHAGGVLHVLGNLTMATVSKFRIDFARA